MMDLIPKNELVELKEYLANISHIKKLTYRELNILLQSNKKQDKISFINGYLQYVVNYVLKIYIKISEYCKIPYGILDFIQEGNEFLVEFIYQTNIKNIALFNYVFRNRLETKIINNFLNISGQTFTDYCNFIAVCDEFYKNNRREPKFSEVKELLNISDENATIANNFYLKHQLSEICLDSDLELYQYTIEEQVYSKIIRECIKNLILELRLTPREKDIIIKRYGLQKDSGDGFNSMLVLEAIASEYNISRQRVDQIVRFALQKIRINPKNLQRLASFR